MTDINNFFPRITVMRIIYIVLVVFTIIGCTDLEQTDTQVSDLQGFPDVELFGGTISFTKEGLQQFQISAPHISRFDRTNLMLFEDGVTADLYDKLGEHTAVLTSEAAEVFEKAQRLLARGNVIVRSDSGIVVYADTLYYTPDDKLVRSDGFVIMVSPDDSVSGWGFIASPDMGDWEIKNTSGSTWREIITDEE
ncbi:MAG: LPS export ABC transporter periplasmic protein LptC [Calditrichaeota bacterium]|nr:LPS export ABC transporter periplasmic protein LptC [Calditrichota bacterium]MBT7788392.1 LPS export ABC transporter periplasmic protein LptC [Calditrichota bacterium]